MNSALDPLVRKKGDRTAVRKASDGKLATARAIARFTHPYLIEMRPFSADEIEFEPELRGGMRLSEICRVRFGSGPVPLAFGLRILLDAMSGLAALHGASLRFSHGEVAPCNIVVGSDGKSRLVPVVAAHFAEAAPPSEEAAGFAAPERLRCDTFDHRADVFSAGVMLWEMITGRSFRGLPPEIITAWVVDGKVPDPVHPDDAPWVVMLAAVAKRALAVNPSDRWPHVGAVGEEIELAAHGHIASVKEVRELLASVAQPKASASPSENPWTPSLSPTAVSIAPTPIPPAPLPPSIQAPQATPAAAHESIPPTRRSPKNRRRQSVIAWSALLAAVVLLAFATREVLEGLTASRSVAASVPAPTFVARTPSSPLVSAAPAAPAAPIVSATSAGPAPSAAPAPIAPDVASGRAAAPGRRPVVKRAPTRKAPAPAAAPPKAPKTRDDAFGI